MTARWVLLAALVAATSGCGARRTRGPATPPPAASPTAAERADDAEHDHDHDRDEARGEEPAADTDAPPVPASAPSRKSAPDAPFRRPLAAASPHPATRHADMSPAACMKEIEAQKLPFARSKQPAAGVASPLRSTGPLHGVRLVIPRAPSKFGILDCRLALALSDMARAAAELGVVEIQIDNTYRKSARLPRRGGGKSQHAYGLAADITTMRLADGQVLRVEPDWHAPIGGTPCGPDAVLEDPTPAAVALRNVVCELARRGVFHHMLTPGYDAAHKNHLHLDIKRGARQTRIH
jgi:hypothetical protein